MPGSHGVIFSRHKRSPPLHRQPFSYVKACRAIETLIFIGTMIALGFSNLGSGHSDVLIMSAVAAEILILMLVLEKIVWKRLPAHIKARVPYDLKEALQQKGDIRSFRDFLKLWRATGSG
jgi:hypothetical protein